METLLLPNPDNIPTIYETKYKDFKITPPNLNK